MGWLDDGGLTGDPDTNWLDEWRDSRVEDGQPIDGADPGYVPGDETAEIDEGAGEETQIGDWWSSYYESEMEDWEETTNDPSEAFMDELRFGLTGPAPSLNEDFSVDFGDGTYHYINTGVWEGLGGDSDDAETTPDSDIPWGLVAAVGLVLVALVVLRPYADLAAGWSS